MDQESLDVKIVMQGGRQMGVPAERQEKRGRVYLFSHHCLHCDYYWPSNTEFPNKCPQCKNHNWDTPPTNKNGKRKYGLSELNSGGRNLNRKY